MQKKTSKFNTFRCIYNKTIKECMNLPNKAPHDKIDTLLGVQSAKNVV